MIAKFLNMLEAGEGVVVMVKGGGLLPTCH